MNQQECWWGNGMTQFPPDPEGVILDIHWGDPMDALGLGDIAPVELLEEGTYTL